MYWPRRCSVNAVDCRPRGVYKPRSPLYWADDSPVNVKADSLENVEWMNFTGTWHILVYEFDGGPEINYNLQWSTTENQHY